MKSCIALFSLIALTGCGDLGYYARMANERGENSQVAAETNTQQDNPNQYAYQQGSNDGCSSGNNAGGNWTYKFQKDVDRYIKDQYYKTGWDDGFTKCKSVADSVGRAVDNALSNPY
jgi:hypothetical protein